MAKFKKDILYAGTWFVPGTAEPVTFSLADLHRLAESSNAKIAEGIGIPCLFEHQDLADQRPTINDLKARLVRNCFGWPTRFYVDGNSLVCEGEAHDAKITDDILAARFASPELVKDWRDGTGRTWPGLSITHVAATPFPVQTPQKPFELMPVSMSRFCLSLSNFQGSAMTPPMPAYMSAEQARREELCQKIMKELPKHGMRLPDDTTSDNFIERLYVAVETRIAVQEAREKERREQQGRLSGQTGEDDDPEVIAMSRGIVQQRRQFEREEQRRKELLLMAAEDAKRFSNPSPNWKPPRS